MRPDLIAVSGFLATFILLIDRFLIINSGWHLSGIAELKRCGGLDISGGWANRLKANLVLVIRVILSIGIAQLTAIFVSILIFAADIDARARSVYLQADAPLIERATSAANAEIQRATDALKVEETRYAALAAQASAVRQNQIDPAANDPLVRQAQQEVEQLLAQKTRDDEELRRSERFESDEQGGIKSGADNSGKAGNGPRHRAAVAQVTSARAHAEATDRALEAARGRLDSLRGRTVVAGEAAKRKAADQTPEFESALKNENAERTRLQEQVTSLEEGRNEKIRRAVEQAPGYVALDLGFLNQIRLLGEIAASDPKLRAVILLIEVTSFGFELASVLGKAASFCPMVYSALLARDVYVGIARIVDEMMPILNKASASDPAACPFPVMPDAVVSAAASADGASSVQPGGAPTKPTPDPIEPAQPAKRPRGRPRKSSVH